MVGKTDNICNGKALLGEVAKSWILDYYAVLKTFECIFRHFFSKKCYICSKPRKVGEVQIKFLNYFIFSPLIPLLVV